MSQTDFSPYITSVRHNRKRGIEVAERVDCKFRGSCKKYHESQENCTPYCYPYVFLHGTDGKGGFWATRNVPKKYSDLFREDLKLIEADNKRIYDAVINYLENVIENVQSRNRGLYFCGGTGTGKTTTAIVILNEYLIERCKQHLQGLKKIEVNPALFVKLSEVQNIYNSQFRGTQDMQNSSAVKYYGLKDKMKTVDLLIIDDIALRGLPEGFMNEMYEILDCRATENLTTIFTSNVPYEELPDYVGDRITSRIQGMAGKQVIFKGTDHREGGLF